MILNKKALCKFFCLFCRTGVDPKSVLCAFFKQGACTKGDKCKFSHDLTIERKAEKRSVYDDGKGGGKGKLASLLLVCLCLGKV